MHSRPRVSTPTLSMPFLTTRFPATPSLEIFESVYVTGAWRSRKASRLWEARHSYLRQSYSMQQIEHLFCADGCGLDRRRRLKLDFWLCFLAEIPRSRIKLGGKGWRKKQGATRVHKLLLGLRNNHVVPLTSLSQDITHIDYLIHCPAPSPIVLPVPTKLPYALPFPATPAGLSALIQRRLAEELELPCFVTSGSSSVYCFSYVYPWATSF